MRMIKKLASLLSVLAALAVMVLAVLLAGAHFAGLTLCGVLSGSMEPTYSAGDLICVRRVEPWEIEVGMPITFAADESRAARTSRVTDVAVRTTALRSMTDEDGAPLLGRDGQPILRETALDEPLYYFRTRGDAQDEEDPEPVSGKNLIGTPVFSLPYLGHLAARMETAAGRAMAACFGLALLILMFLPEMMQATGHDGRKADEDGPDEDGILCEEADAPGDDVLVEDR